MTNYSLSWDYADLKRFQESLISLGEKPTVNAAKKAAQKGSNVVGKAIRKAAPTGDTGQLKRGFKKKKERSSVKGKAVYQYAMDSAKNNIFQKPIINVGKYGGKSKHAYYPASVEYGFLVSYSEYGGFEWRQIVEKHEPDSAHFTKKATEQSAPAALSVMSQTLNSELDKEWAKK